MYFFIDAFIVFLSFFRALRTESWGDVWLNDLVEICALVNLGLTCLLFLYAALLEFIDVRCLSKSRAVLRQLLKERSSSNRRGLHYAHQGYLNSGEILLKYLSPITLRRYATIKVVFLTLSFT